MKPSTDMGNDEHLKLKELILYISEKCQFRPNFGATMLNKILFFSDFMAYAKFKESITGEDYFKLPYGPAPKYLLEAQESLLKEDLIIIQQRETINGIQKRTIPTGREANLSIFRPEFISIVDEVIEAIKDENAESVSGLSHKFYGWQIAKEREVIPYSSIFLVEPRPKDPPPQVKKIIRKLAQNES